MIYEVKQFLIITKSTKYREKRKNDDDRNEKGTREYRQAGRREG